QTDAPAHPADASVRHGDVRWARSRPGDGRRGAGCGRADGGCPAARDGTADRESSEVDSNAAGADQDDGRVAALGHEVARQPIAPSRAPIDRDRKAGPVAREAARLDGAGLIDLD